MSRTPRLTKKFSKPTLSRFINGDITIDASSDRPETTRLDVALVEKYPEYNRSFIQKAIKNGDVSVNDTIVTKPATLIEYSDKVILKVDEPGLDQPSDTKPALVPKTLYEDDNVLVLDKPAGLLSMSKGDHNPEPTLEDYGLLVHRLDRGTSGVIILAKNEKAKSLLQKQFQDRKAHKTYYAIVVGHPEQPHAIINIPLARSTKRPTTFQPSESGREAITEYEVVDQNDKYSLLKIKPTTGRTHQIRIHLAYIGTPILGDDIYGKTRADRMYLHAKRLEITIPGSIRKTFTSPLPEDFDNVFRRP